jgi:dienelactone hydrolase
VTGRANMRPRGALSDWPRTLLPCAAVLLLVAGGRALADCDAYATYDRPSLAVPGSLPVGRRSLALEVAAPTREGATPSARSLELLVWYPAEIDDCVRAAPYRQALARHAWRPLPSERISFDVPAAAVADAPVAGGARYPLVVLSHGLLGWASALTYLGEHLASRGYVVAAIDHRDDLPTGLDPLKGATVFRPVDQSTAVAALRSADADPRSFLHHSIDAERVAIVGYSMGGYGALKSAVAAGSATGQQLRAVVAIAPFGGQSFVGAFDRTDLATASTPMLFIVGDHDDVSGFSDGVESLFRSVTGAERWMLTYENARHNVGGYPLPDFARGELAPQSLFIDPVWRIERIQAVNRHFITAFLDLTLKGEANRRTYLEPPAPRSNDGHWPAQGNLDLSDPVADAASAPGFWPGFRRRSALGLELRHLVPGMPDLKP